MRTFYEEWSNYFKSVATAAEILEDENQGDEVFLTLQSTIRSPLATELNLDEFFNISFTHHCEILVKTQDFQERIFYIHQAYINKWDKYKLRDLLKADLYHHQGQLPNNFAKTIPASKNAIRAIEMFKDEYLLDFINVEEIGARDEADVDEREVEQAIIQNVKNFIMTFGRDFAFVGNQYHLEI